MNDEKIKMINELGNLLHDVLWVKLSKNKKQIKELEKLILVKKKLDFTKEEFIEEYFFSNELFPSKQIAEYDNIDHFILLFFKDSYDAVTFKTSDYSTIQLLRERIKDFDLLIEEYNEINNPN